MQEYSNDNILVANYHVNQLIDIELGLYNIQLLIKKEPNTEKLNDAFWHHFKLVKAIIKNKEEFNNYIFYFAYLFYNKGQIGSKRFSIKECEKIDIDNFNHFENNVSISILDDFLKLKNIEKNETFFNGSKVNTYLRLMADKLQDEKWFNSGAWTFFIY